MLARRGVLALLAFAAAPAAAADETVLAVEFIRRAGNELGEVAAAGGNAEERRARLRAFIERTVDVDGVARFCLGRFWRMATPEQQREYTGLFHEVLLNAVASRVGDYPKGSAQVTIATPQHTPDGMTVATIVQRGNLPAARIVWAVSMEGGQPRIVDVSAEGISLRVTQRSDYQAFLVHNHDDVGALIGAMRGQLSLGR